MPWYINGDYIVACNCNYGCPCNSNLPPTQEVCEGVSLLRIDDGEYNGVRLDGRKCGFASRWPGRIHEGNGVVSFYIDADQDTPEWNALHDIITGRAGGPLSLLAHTYSLDKMFGPHLVDIQIDGADENTVVNVVDLHNGKKRVHMTFERILVAGNPVYSTVVPTARSVYQEGGDQYALQAFSVEDEVDDLNFNHPSKCAQYARVHWKVP
jgi:hypothetical protein